MAISPWYVGQQLPVQTISLVDDTGLPISLTGATLSLSIHNVATGIDTAATGTLTVTNATAGTFTYAPSSADVASAGNYILFFVVTYSGGPLNADPIPWEILGV